MESGKSAGFNDGKNTDFWISQATEITPTHLAFETDSRNKVEPSTKPLCRGEPKITGGPGYRDYSPGYYAAFVLDPDGNNIEAVWYDSSKTKWPLK
jgi:hypothetical protein